MGLTRTPVQINTAKARKASALYGVELANINGIDKGYKALNYNGVYQGKGYKMTQKDYFLAGIFDRAGW